MSSRDTNINMNDIKYISQIELAKLSNKKKQWINYLVKNTDRFNTVTIAGKLLIIHDQKVINFINENKGYI